MIFLFAAPIELLEIPKNNCVVENEALRELMCFKLKTTRHLNNLFFQCDLFCHGFVMNDISKIT